MADDGFDITHQRRGSRPAAGFTDVDPVEIGHDAVLLTVIDPRCVVQIIDLHAARAAVIVKARVVQPKLMAKFVNEGIKHITADVCSVRLGIVETLANADIAIV